MTLVRLSDGTMPEDAIISERIRIRHPSKFFFSKGVIVDDFSYFSTEVQIGVYSHLAPNITISGGQKRVVTIGRFCGISAGVSIHASSSDYIGFSMDLPSVPTELQFGGESEDIAIGDFCLLGAKSTILPGVQLPEGVSIAAGAVVSNRHYDPWTLITRTGESIPRNVNRKLISKLRSLE